MTARLSLWSDFSAAGGVRYGSLGELVDGTARYAVAGDSSLTVTVRRERWQTLAGALRHVLRVNWPEGTVDEWRIARVFDTGTGTTIQLQARPVFADLVTGGPIVRTIGGVPATRLAGELLLSVWLAQYVVTHDSAARLNLVVGTLARDPVLLGEFDAPAPGVVILELFAKAGLEAEFVRTNETTWTLNGVLAVGSSATPITIRSGTNQIALTAGVDDEQLATVVIPFGDAHPDTGDRATMALVRYDVTALPGSAWVTIRDPETNSSPILVDGQWVGAAVQLEDLSTRTIIGARVSDGSVQLSSVTGVTVGTRLGLSTITGGPLIEVFDEPTVAASGRRVVPKTWSGLRGEANLLKNARFANAITDWFAHQATTPPAFAEVRRDELAQAVTFAANGARAAGVSAVTPLAVDGLTPTTGRVLRGDVITQAGATHALSAVAIPNTSGALTLSLATGLTANVADNDAVTFVRREIATMTVAVAMPRMGRYLILSNTNTDLVQRLAAFARTDGSPFITPGDLKLLMSTGETFDNNLVRLHAFPGDAQRLVVEGIGQGGAPPAPTHTLTNFTVYSVLAAQRLRCLTPVEVASGVVVFSANLYGGGTNLPPWWDGGAQFAGSIVATGTDAGQSYIDIDILGLPSATNLTGIYGPVVSSLLQVWATSVVWSGTSTATWQRETRTLRYDGAYTAGATSVTMKTVAAIATRNWQNGDTLYAEGYSWSVTAAASWATTGLATVTVSIPSGVVLPAGTRLWSNWHGSSAFDSMMVLATAVTGPVSSVSVRASDDFPYDWDGFSGQSVALYRAGTDSYLEVLGNTMIAAATATANGSGQANVTLTAANTNAVPDNAVLRVTRPAMLRTTDAVTGSVVRLLSPVGSPPNSSSPGLRSNFTTIPVPAGETRVVTALVTFAMSAGVHSHVPGVSISNNVIGLAIAAASAAPGSVTVLNTPTIVRVIVQATLTELGQIGVRIHGGANDATLWQVALDAMLCISSRDDIPFIASSWANQLAQRGADTLAAQRLPVANVVLDVALLRRWSDAAATTTPVVLGQTVIVPAVGVTRRVVVYERSLIDPQVGRVEVGTVPTDLSRRVAAAAP